MKGSHIFAQSLDSLGLAPLFGNPGTTEIPMLRSVKNYVLALHDSIALGLADGRAQITGLPAACNLHTMPGIGNSMAFLHTAQANRSPVIVTSGQQDYRHIFQDPLLSGDLTGTVSGLVKYRYEIKGVDDIERAMRRAYRIAMTPPFGPVFLSFPDNILDLDGQNGGVSQPPVNNSLCDDEAVFEIMDVFNEASSPAIVFGYEIDLFHAMEEARTFAEKTGCPAFAEPLASRSPFPSDSAQYAGDLPPAATLINVMLQPYDLILIVGGDLTLYPYTPSPLLSGKKVMSVGLDLSGKNGDYYQMNPRNFLQKAVSRVKRRASYVRRPDYSMQSRIANARKRMEPLFPLTMIKSAFSDHVIVDESVSASQTLRAAVGYRPMSYFTSRTGQLGWALPAAAGMATATMKVLCVLGDGSFMYTPQTLWTIKHYNLPVKVIILNNGGYMILRSYSSSYYQELKDTDFFKPEIDVAKMVGSFGIECQVADSALSNMTWLREGNTPKVLVVNVSREIPKLFI